MDSSGRSIANVHNGDTFINGSLTVQEQILVGDAEGKSEYLDSGKYTQTFSNPFYVDAFFYNNETYYTKNGNFVTIIFNVGLLTPSFTFQTSRNQAFDVTVPSLDLFDTKMVTAPPVGTGGNSLFQVTNITYQSEGVIRITLTASDSTLSTTRPLNSNFSVTYKLEGDDIPATAIISGGGGSGGDVRNPMIENLDGGGFNIINVDTLAVNNVTAQGTITANLISAPNVVTNPLTSLLDVNNLGLTNVAIISGSGGETKFGGDRLKDVGEVNNSGTLLIDGNVGLDLDSLSGTINTLTNVDCKTNQLLNSSVIETNLLKSNSGSDLTIEAVSLGSNILIAPNFLFRTTAQEIELYTSGSSIVLDVNGNTTLMSNNLMNISANGIVMSGLLDMTTNNIENATDIKCIDLTANRVIARTGQDLLLSSGGGAVNLFNNGNITIFGNNQITFLSSAVVVSSPNVTMGGTLNMVGNDITNVSNITNTSDMAITSGGNVSILSDPGAETLIGNLSSHKYVGGTERKIVQKTDRLELDNSSGLVETVHIYDANGFFEESTITEGGFDFYQLQDNITYVIHGDVTVTQGFKFGINNVIKGESLSASLTFDETSANIIGFKAVDQNLVISNLSVFGGGGHFSNSNVGLFSATNFNTGASAPFYGRNKRFFIDTCNIFFPFSLGSVRGFGTSNVLSSFFNGGGGSPSGIYTNFGLSIADGLSCEIRGNKFVLFKGAQASSTLKMINFADATLTPVVLGFNAVNVVSNIIHPRDQETGIDFSENSLTKLGVISGNTFIRTGGVEPLINYQRADTFDNYNVKAIETYEISGNIGVIDSEPILQCSCGLNNSVSSATYIDLDIPITSINPIINSKRFAYKFIATGVTGGSYTKGNYLVSVTDTSKYGYIVDVETVLAGTDILYIVDMTGIFPNLTNYKEQDSGLVDTGVTSTGLDIGDNSNNIELYYFDKDPHDIQFGIQINYDNDSKEDEIQFRLVKDSGSGYVELVGSQVSALQAKDGRVASCNIIYLEKMQFGDLIKIQYRYIDTTTTDIQSINFTGK